MEVCVHVCVYGGGGVHINSAQVLNISYTQVKHYDLKGSCTHVLVQTEHTVFGLPLVRIK